MATNSGSTRTLFATPEFTKTWLALDSNIDEPIITATLRDAEDVHIKAILGGNLYYTLIEKINSNTLTGDYKFLMDNFVIACLMQYFLYEFTFTGSYKFKNIGMVKQVSENSESVSEEERNKVRTNIMKKAMALEDAIIRETRVNSHKYPEINMIAPDMQAPRAEAYRSTIFVPGMYNRGKWNTEDLYN
jgi:hypothetical protein